MVITTISMLGGLLCSPLLWDTPCMAGMASVSGGPRDCCAYMWTQGTIVALTYIAMSGAIGGGTGAMGGGWEWASLTGW